MAKTSWYTRQAAADEARKAGMAARFSELSERELVAELGEIERDDRAMRLDRTANQSGWERLAARSQVVRAELAARRSVVESPVESAPVPSAPVALARTAPMTTERIFINAAERALERAYANNAHDSLSAIESDDSGAIALYHKDDSIYVVTLAECSCKGSQIGRHLCFHQLALADRVGMLDRFIPGAYTRPLPAVRAVSPVVAAELIAA